MPNKKIIFFVLTLSLLSLLDYGLHPKIATIVEKEIRKEIQKAGVAVEFSSIDYGYFPPHIKIKDLAYKDKSVVAMASSISLSAQVLPLIKAQIRPRTLKADNLNASINLSVQSNKPSSKIDLKKYLELSKLSKLIPVNSIKISNSKLILIQKKDIYNLDLEQLELKKIGEKLQLEAKSKISLKASDAKESFQFNTKVRWQEKGFFINFLNLQKQNSIVQISGFIKNSILKMKKVSLAELPKKIEEIRISINSDLSEFNPLLKTLLKKHTENRQIKDFSGRLQASGYYLPSSSQNSESEDKGLLSLQADDIITPFASIQQFNFKGEISQRSLISKQLDFIFNEKSKLSFNNLTIKDNAGSYLISTDLKSKRVSIENVMESLNLKADNLKTPLSISAHCGGVLYKKTLLKCKGSGELFSFDILNLPEKTKLISTKGLGADFEVSLTQKDLNFETQLKYTDKKSGLVTTGAATGSVDFIKGFDVNFYSAPLDLNFINTISGLSFAGTTALKGQTKGSSKWGEFQTSLSSTDFKLNKMFMGNSTSEMSYKFPKLEVNKIKGQVLNFENTYSGDVSLNVEQNTLNIDLLGQNINDEGLRKLFDDRFSFPEDIKFQSNFILSASNSLDINKMDLSLSAKLSQLDIFGEQFKTGMLKLKGPGGKWEILEGSLQKDSAKIRSRGFFQGLESMDVRVLSENMKFEDSDFLTKLGLKLQGPLKLTLDAKGLIEGPEAIGTLTAINTLGPHKNNLGNSALGYRLFKDDLFFKGSVFKNSFEGEGVYPLSPEGRIFIKGSFKNFNILNFISFNAQNTKNTRLLINGSADIKKDKTTKDYLKGELKGLSVNLYSDRNKLLSVVQQENTKLSKPLVFKGLQKGLSSAFSLDLSKRDSKAITYSGTMNIDFLQPLIPSCEFISGEFSSEKLIWTSSSNQITSKGTAELKDAVFKTSQFPYSFSKINSDIAFLKEKMIFKGLNSYVANTRIYAEGYFQTSSPLKLNIDLNYKNLNIEFPKKVSTTSNAQLNISGTRIPLSVSGSLNVTDGLFSKDLLSSQSYEVVTPNKRLPTKILRKSSPPAELKNIRVRINKKMAIRNNEAQGNVTGNLIANGNPAAPTLKGSLKLIPGLKINFQENTFNLNEGLVSYDNKAVDSPDIFIDALSNIKDNNDPLEKEYSIRLLAKGEASTPNIKFSSQPSLDEQQIISLLTIGTVSTQSLGQEINAQEQAAFSGLQFGSYLVQKNQALKDLQKKTGTQIGVSSSLNSGGVNPKVFVRKSWTPKSSSTISQTFGNQRNLTFSTEYKLNKKTSTVFGFQNNQSQDPNQLNNRRVQQNLILDLGLQYKFEFE